MNNCWMLNIKTLWLDILAQLKKSTLWVVRCFHQKNIKIEWWFSYVCFACEMNGINKVVVKQYLIIEITSIMLDFYLFLHMSVLSHCWLLTRFFAFILLKLPWKLLWQFLIIYFSICLCFLMVNVQIFWFDDKELPISEVATENFSKFSSVTYFW